MCGDSVDIGPVNRPTTASKCSGGRNSRTSEAGNQKRAGMSLARTAGPELTARKPRPPAPSSQPSGERRGRAVGGNQQCCSADTRAVRKLTGLLPMRRAAERSARNSKATATSPSAEGWSGARPDLSRGRGGRARGAQSAAGRAWFVGCRPRSRLLNTEATGEAAGCAEDLARRIPEGGYADQQIFHVDEAAFCWEGVHAGLPWPERRQCPAPKLQRTGCLSC